MKILNLQHIYRQTKKRGFTIVEALVAIFILTTAITALLTVVTQSVFNSSYIKNKTSAMALAQEGVELVRNIQDSNLLQNEYQSFEVFAGTVFTPCIFNEGMCTIDPLSLEIESCPNQECPPLRQNDGGYITYLLTADETPFTRYITIRPTGQRSGIVGVRVEWEQGAVTREVYYETDLFLWID